MTRTTASTCRRVAAASLVLLLGACATEQQQVASKEDRLAAAGFIARPADTPQREAMLQRLPAEYFAKRDVNGHYVYLYGDPLVCGCVYVGSEQAYGRYREQMIQQRLADEQAMTAQLYSDPGWDFGGWGGPWGPGFGAGFGPGFY